jgi:hypothetical protein
MICAVKYGYVTWKESKIMLLKYDPENKAKEQLPRIEPLNSRFTLCNFGAFISSPKNSSLKMKIDNHCQIVHSVYALQFIKIFMNQIKM